MGWLPPDRLDALYRDALAVVVPTQGHEAFGLVAAEALARGTPTVLHRFGALEELLEDTGAGVGYRAPGSSPPPSIGLPGTSSFGHGSAAVGARRSSSVIRRSITYAITCR